MSVGSIYRLGPTVDPNYPQLLANHPRNRPINWRAVGNYSRTGTATEPGPWNAFVKSDRELDAVWMAGVGAAVSGRLKDAIESAAGSSVEFLPFRVNDLPFWILRVVTVIDALDIDKSDIRYFPDGTWDAVDFPRWIAARIPDHCLFRIPQEKKIWATPAVAEAYDASGCNGLHFAVRGEMV